MSNKETIKEYLSYGLSALPTKEDKLPALTTWADLQKKRLSPEEVDLLFKGATIREDTVSKEKTDKAGKKTIEKGIKAYNLSEKIGIITGAISGNLEVIDVDTKYDITGSLWTDLRELIENTLPEVLKALVISQTMSGGYHLYYKCSEIGKNDKLARRPATAQEIEKGDKINVLIETRGEGGYVIAPPSPGYRFIQGAPSQISTISPEDRSILLSIARSFDQIPKEEPKRPASPPQVDYNSSGLGSFEDYNQRGDIVALLGAHGWRVVNETGDRIYLLRPGETKAKTSGNYHKGKRLFFVWSTSTEFEPEVGYNPTQVFTLLEGGGDLSTASKKLYSLGYGDRKGKPPTEVKTDRIKVEGVNVSGDSSTLSEPGRSLKTESIKTGDQESYNIYYTSTEATGEILRALELLEAITEARIYLKEVKSLEALSEVKKTLPSFVFKLWALFDKYDKKEELSGPLQPEDWDSLLEEIVKTATRIKEPIDRDRFTKLFISQEGIKALGITEESLRDTVDKIRSKKDKETQAKEFKELLSEITQLQAEGKIGKALEVMGAKTKEIKLRDKDTEFSSLLIPTNEEEIRQRISSKPDSLNSGYTIGGEDLLLPSGSISIFSAPTSHGKTTFLINLALNVARAGVEAHLFSYEEDRDTILINTLNSYIGEEISINNTKSLKHYFTTGSDHYIKTDKRGLFTASKDKFFKELITPRGLNIHYTSYDSDTLIEAIRYLHKTTSVGAVFIDYIQLLNLPKGKYKTYSRQEEIKEICIALKDVAVETGLPIILGAQFNREVINQLKLHATKIGEAGDIERIANLIVGFWNNNFKALGTDGELSDINTKGWDSPNTLYTVVLKNRGGKVGQEELLSWDGNSRAIKNRALSKANSIFD